MKIMIVMLTVIFFSINDANSEESENCEEYKISLKALKCNIEKRFQIVLVAPTQKALNSRWVK